MPAKPPVSGHCDSRFEAVRDVFTANLESGADLGAGVAFTLDGELVVDLWGGFLDLDHESPWERDSLVNLYSTTKGTASLPRASDGIYAP